MFRAVEIQPSLSTIPSSGTSRAKLATSYYFVKFLIWELVIVLIAGIAVPRLLWTRPTLGHALNARFPHVLRIARITIRYSYQDIEFAILGALLGTAVAWKLYCPKKSAGKAARFFWQTNLPAVYLVSGTGPKPQSEPGLLGQLTDRGRKSSPSRFVRQNERSLFSS